MKGVIIMRRHLSIVYCLILVLLAGLTLSLSSCGRPIHSEALAKQQDQQLPDNAEMNADAGDPGFLPLDESEDAGNTKELPISFSLQKEEAAWFGTGNRSTSDLVAHFTSTEELESFFRDKYQHMEPGDNEDLKKHWDVFVQPVIDAARAAYGTTFFENRELLLYCVKTGTSTYQPGDYALLRSGPSVTLLYSVQGPEVGADGIVKTNNDLGLFPILLAVDKNDLAGVTAFQVSPRR